MEKLEAVQRVFRFSKAIREWCEMEHSLSFSDFDEVNVDDYEEGYGPIADEIIQRGVDANILDDEDIENLD
ncbi:MAG: hypothetical protein COV67_15490 [Nitrospinae bacterium CG11_big_fil_rev_8_21_14_0_20_56_8]|nr:MAG: hypothetical protein COV67_15490 [Nitrospinae bacterium CG11_big_fil_rev_8_21_14_0_20_56_8]